MSRLVSETILDGILKETLSMIQFFCRMEQRRSFVMNDKDYRKLRESFESDMAYSDSYETELAIISHVRAYFDVASKRLIETVPMICDTSMALKLIDQLDKSFAKQLGITGEEGNQNAKKFLQEDVEVKEKRESLSRQKEIVESAERILASVKY